MAAPTPSIPLSPELPAGLPDTLQLARWAGELFNALPNGAQHQALTPPDPNGITTPLPHQLPTNIAPESAQSAQVIASAAPALVPDAQAGNGVPDFAATHPHGFIGSRGGHAQTVPQAYAAVPAADVPAPPATDQLFYFLAEPQTPALPSSSAPDQRLGLSAYALPGLDDLAGLILAEPRTTDAPVTSTSNFYFLDGSLSPNATPFGEVPTQEPERRVAFDVNTVRRDFPILAERVNGRPLVWFDNAATTHKPQAVIDRLAYFYAHENSNIHRAAHELAARATDAYEDARKKVARFIGAGSTDEIIFVRGATEAINLIAKTWGKKNIGAGDEIIVSNLEHHANIVPWLQLAQETGAKLRVIPVDDSGQVLLGEYQRLLSPRTKLVSVTQVSNALGTVVPVKEIIDLAHRVGAKALVDGAQSVSHMRVDVQALDADFFVFSGHKVFAPTGIGVAYGKRAILEDMPAWQGGGNMISDVTFERALFQGPPSRFEAGTGNIADAAGLGAAIDYVERIGIENIAAYEHELLDYATALLKDIPGLRLIGTAQDKASVLSFVLTGYAPEEVGKALNEEGIAVRAGHHCAQPILRRFGQEATVRASLAFYNTREEVELLAAVLRRLRTARPV
ncbi:family 2A encapsulin nanocompartment cargo protein cysteine desulfurase [Rhodanobacter sp. MP1X3]|uniref:family 2A encapsulin nanocompartment cargo protein cysteine desulfurase n=1 Tax=Rhodanobacter sp. MP1X3 TaxID=2723086 RepID=UPI0016114273|nr:family 2A encapsulin nanocompartment cargo protein cysteine desulfurase [Rhodanobacter sp. MP1X3]MBB6242727.1 cysteine desulfurase/selenocysteine lyase [Rhodanobacter sp. MP1X3]